MIGQWSLLARKKAQREWYSLRKLKMQRRLGLFLSTLLYLLILVLPSSDSAAAFAAPFATSSPRQDPSVRRIRFRFLAALTELGWYIISNV
jgi:hypothetical protein